MSNIDRLIDKFSRFLNKSISLEHKINHKYQNKNQVTTMFAILNLLKKKNYNPNFIFDVGSGIGEWTKQSLKIFSDSRYYLFDADSNNFEKLSLLKKNYSNISFKINLLSDDINTYKFYNMGYGSSIFEEQTKHNRYVEKLNSITLYDEISDDVLNKTNNLIKLDVQGSEIKILDGLKERINIFEVIILEVSLHNYNKNSPLIDSVMRFMEKQKFRLYDICDLKRLGNEKSFLLQLDCVFVRQNSQLFDVKF